MLDIGFEFEVVITKNDLGFVVYDKVSKDGIDVFPDTPEGFNRLMMFLERTLGQERNLK